MIDPDFSIDEQGLQRAIALMQAPGNPADTQPLPEHLPEAGIGANATLEWLAPIVLGGAHPLGTPVTMAHMDPPTPWISWATTLWNASLNQNLLHPACAPVARDVEQKVIDWVSPYFGMDGGHLVPGATVATLTALWAARETKGINQIVVGEAAHLSVGKVANILGLPLVNVACDANGSIVAEALPADLSRSALVLTAGTTSTGAVDDLSLIGLAAWTHVDAAWAGPLRFSARHASVLDGIERADSVCMSAHKWFFQPKESALILFRDVAVAHQSISFGGAYLAAPNIGLLGSHGATAVPLLATLIAWGRAGLAQRIDRCMAAADTLAAFITQDDRLDLLCPPATGVVVWQPRNVDTIDTLFAKLPEGSVSKTSLDSGPWLRNVAANPNVDVGLLCQSIASALDG